MKVDIDGTLYEWDADAFTLAEAFEMKEKTGLGLRAFSIAYLEREPVALAYVAYLARTRAGETVDDWMSSFTDVTRFLDSVLEGERAEDVAAANPTQGQTDSD